MKQRIPVLRIEDCNYILFSEFWPEDSEGNLRSWSKLPPAHLSTTHGGGFTLSLFNAERQAGKQWIPIFLVLGLTRPGIEPETTISVADGLSTRPLIISACQQPYCTTIALAKEIL